MRSSSGVAFIRSAPPLTPLPHVSFFLSALLSIRPGGLVGYACASERVSVPVNERVRERERERERESCKSKWRVRPQPMTQYDGLVFLFLANKLSFESCLRPFVRRSPAATTSPAAFSLTTRACPSFGPFVS